jgi:hypothetical protein
MSKGYRGGFLNKVNRAVAKQHAAKGTNHYSSRKPKTGRFNARGLGRRAYANGIGPSKGWTVQNGTRYRARRVVVKVRVSKLRRGESRAAYLYKAIESTSAAHQSAIFTRCSQYKAR